MRQRLLNLAGARGEELEFVLVLYTIERLLYRLSVSPHAHRFLLKGAMLFFAWHDVRARPTRDLDLLGYGEISPESLRIILDDLCALNVPDDGLRFDRASIKVRPIREAQEYGGLRATFAARLGTAVIRCQVDVGTGDAVTPAPEPLDYPTLLDHAAPRLRAYPRETVVAEKLQAMAALGIANSRMKDFYDLWLLARSMAFSAATLALAIRATFDRRGTALPASAPLALTDDFLADRSKQAQWVAFTRRSRLTAPAMLSEAGREIAAFVELPLHLARAPTDEDHRWPPGGPWSRA